MPCVERFTLKSRQDGLELSAMLVQPEGQARVLVQLAHGMCEHKERYLPFMQYLAEHGCACVMNDHRDHGASVRSLEDLGYFYEDGDGALVEDLHQITLWMKERWPGVPLVLFGHSMGSMAVRAYCEKYDGELAGLIVCGSPGNNPASGVGLMLVELIARFKGERYRSRLLRELTTGGYAKKYAHEGKAAAWISASEDNVKAYEADPLCSFSFTVNGIRALMRLMRRAYGLRPPRGNAGLKIRFYSGEDDPCAPDRRGFEAAMEAMRRAGYTDVEGRMFPGLRHEILNEDCAQEIFEEIWSEAIAPCAKA